MSEERENEKEAVSIEHTSHDHPLTLIEADKRCGRCDGCERYIHPKDKAYTCREGCDDPILHEECAEMPREIRLSMHPQHTFIQDYKYYSSDCKVCDRIITGISYCCAVGCRFQVHIGCAHNMEVPQVCINHPSHPQHQLSFFSRPGRSCVLRCDACGTIERGNSYVCSGCQYWIHESCARLSPTEHFKHHDHPLSLIYHLPIEYIKFDAKCHICLEALLARYWVYHCEICRYVVHVKCAVKDKDVIYFPIKDVVKELIRYFTKVGGVTTNSNEMVNSAYKFHIHEHQLYLTSSSLHDPEEVDDDDGFYCGDKSGLVCDGCTMQIFPNKQRSSHEEKERDDYVDVDVVDYMSCRECKYFLHSPCFHLQPCIFSHPLHSYPNHYLTLQTCQKLDFVCCEICRICTNGLYYGCTNCSFKVDIKCASLPDTIIHAAHSRHHLMLLNTDITIRYSYKKRLCGACGWDTYRYVCYRCDICGFILHSSCALLPAVVANPRWDKHPLRLTFDAGVYRRGRFYCQVCEEEMDPERWMYHCQDCDIFIHPKCSPTALGEHRNIKFGGRYDVGSLHHHPVALQLLTKKLHCDVCGQRKDYGCKGLQCVSDKCEFFLCFDQCYGNHRAEIKVLIEEASSSDH